MSNNTTIEQDYPKGHPSRADYAGEKYTPPAAPWTKDYPDDHPARGGKNISTLDTPDGQVASTIVKTVTEPELLEAEDSDSQKEG